jgi:hypothetical protein
MELINNGDALFNKISSLTERYFNRQSGEPA